MNLTKIYLILIFSFLKLVPFIFSIHTGYKHKRLTLSFNHFLFVCYETVFHFVTHVNLELPVESGWL